MNDKRCHGSGEDHCCWFGSECPFLEEWTLPGRRWACGLLREHGSWERVYEDVRYRRLIRLAHRALPEMIPPDLRCGDWPQNMPDIMANAAMGKCCFGGD